MADPDQDQDDLVSQDDIDKLLEFSSIEAAEERLNAADTDETEEMEEMGELSQDDIDSLLNNGTQDTEEDARGEAEDEMDEFSRDDIETLMGKDANDVPDDDQTDDQTNDQADDDQSGEMELIDQTDIDRLMNGSLDQADQTTSGDNPEPVSGDGFVILADQAKDVSDCLITQETLDTLMQNRSTVLPASDPVILDEADPDSLHPDEVTQEDIDALLQEEEDEKEEEYDREGDPGDEIYPEDGDGDVVEDENNILISQDDIDILLTASDQEDEDILGGALGDDFDRILADDFADEDISSNDQVILRGLESVESQHVTSKTAKEDKKWYRSRLLLFAASVVLLLGIAVPGAYFIFFPKDSPPVADNQAALPVSREVNVPAIQTDNADVANVQVDVVPLPPVKKPGKMVLKDFIVLASDRSADMAYVSLDIAIDYSDQPAYHEINNNLSFFRDVIYESIRQNLVWEKRNEVTEKELIMGVEDSLKKVLPAHYIETVSFTSFTVS